MIESSSTQSPAVELVPATSAEDAQTVACIAELINCAYRVSEAGLWTEGTLRTDDREVADLIRLGEIVSARSGDLLVGAIRVHQLDADTAGLGMLAASASHRGQGIGTRLVDFAEHWALGRGLATMQLEVLMPRDWAHPSKTFLLSWYQRIGYEQLRSNSFGDEFPSLVPLLATPCDFVVFRKHLAARVAAGPTPTSKSTGPNAR